MFDFLKKDKEKKEVKEHIEEEIQKHEDEKLPHNDDDIQSSFNSFALIKELEYTNTYLAQLLRSQSELVKQQTIANALSILNHQYEHPDSFMSIDEIQKKYLALAREIFVDYQDDDLSNLEEKE